MNWRIRIAIALAWTAVGNHSHAGVLSGNGIYDIFVQEIADGFQIGSWTAATGASHPTGGGNDLLFSEFGGSFSATTNFSSLRVYNAVAPVDYTFGGAGGGVDLDPFVVSQGASPLGLGTRTTWSVTPESLRIVQDVIVAPSAAATVANSAIYHTVEITNGGNDAANVGWRNLYDWQVDDPTTDDGPNNSIENGGATVVTPTTFEFSHTPNAGDIVRVSVDPGVPSYEALLGIGFDPGFLSALTPTIPDEYAYVSWSGAVGTAFDYTPGVADVTGDSAGLTWFGRDAGRAIGLLPGESVRLTQVLFGVVPDAPPPATVPEPTSFAVWALIGFASLGRRRCRH